MDSPPCLKRKSNEPINSPCKKPVVDEEESELDSSQEFDAQLLANWSDLEREHSSVSSSEDLDEDVASSSVGINCLPAEILQLIFSNLPLRQLLSSVCLSCRAFNDVIKAKDFLKWQKRYTQYRSHKWDSPEARQLTQAYLDTAGMADVETCLIAVILSIRQFRPEPLAPICRLIEAAWQRHPLSSATLTMLSRSPFTVVNEEDKTTKPPNLWMKLAGLLLLCNDVPSIMQLFRLITLWAPTELQCVKEVVYYMATLFTAAHRRFATSSRHFYLLHHALFLLENSKATERQMTEEQKLVADYKLQPNDLVRIVAFAGTGKTSTLMEFCRNHPHLRILVLLYNRDTCDRVSGKFPFNAHCQTLHSLAFKHVGYQYKEAKRFFGNLTSANCMDLCNGRKGLSLFVRAKLVLQTMTNFFGSDATMITLEHVPDTAVDPDGRTINIAAVYQNEIKQDATTLWNRLLPPHSTLPAPHDLYFKVFQLSKPTLEGFDAILVDEAQDLTPAAIDIIQRQNVPKLLVGDPYQQIYSWRGAVNALDQLNATKTFCLTQSFRFGPEIAYLANSCISALQGDQSKLLVGVDKPTCLLATDITLESQVVILCRLNFTVFAQIPCGPVPKIHVIGGLASLGLEMLWDLYTMYLPPEQRQRSIATYALRKFHSFGEVVKHANVLQDQELLGKLRIVNHFGLQMPECIKSIERHHVGTLNLANFVLSTVHKAKGMEFDTVMIGSDLGPQDAQNASGVEREEINLLYVAVTRAKRNLIINANLTRILYEISHESLYNLMPGESAVRFNDVWVKMMTSSRHLERLPIDDLPQPDNLQENLFYQCVSCDNSFEVENPDDLVWYRKPLAVTSPVGLGVGLRKPGVMCRSCAIGVEPISHHFTKEGVPVAAMAMTTGGLTHTDLPMKSDGHRWSLRPIIAAERWDPL